MKKLKLNNIKLSTKMIFVLIIPVISTMLVTGISTIYTNKIHDELVKNIYEETHQSEYWLLNADRDFYQAKVAQMEMENGTGQQRIKEAKDSYLENYQQTIDRVHKARDIIYKDKTKFENLKHRDSKLTIIELFDLFDKDFANWSSLLDIDKNVVNNKAEYNKQFDTARERINQIEEIMDDYNLKMIDESKENVKSINTIIIMISICTICFSALLGLFLIVNVKRRIDVTVGFMKKTAELDLEYDESYEKYTVEKDEFAEIINAEANIRKEFRGIIGKVMNETKALQSAIELTNKNMSYLESEIDDISATTEELSAGMEETAASTEEMNATTTEMENTLHDIASKTLVGVKTAEDINKRANKLKENFSFSYENALEILNQVKVKLEQSLTQSKAVKQINELTDSILEITAQTNLLALNAAIEAAKAGDAGKGFAVVADEIRILAETSKETATQIQQITNIVVNSVENLSCNSNELLEFVENDVTKDYKTMLGATDQYKLDAEIVSQLVGNFSITAEQLLSSIEEMVTTMNGISEATNEGATGASNIAQKVFLVVNKVNEVGESINSTGEGSDTLSEMVSKFKV